MGWAVNPTGPPRTIHEGGCYDAPYLNLIAKGEKTDGSKKTADFPHPLSLDDGTVASTYRRFDDEIA